jgi:predicted DNA-binding transcriptional regulator AlpA
MEMTFEKLPQAVSRLYTKLENIERLLLERIKEPQTSPEQLLNIQQAGNLLNLSVATLYGYVQRAAIPVSKKGKRLYFSKAELLEWVKEGRKKTISEIEAEADQYLIKKNRG